MENIKKPMDLGGVALALAIIAIAILAFNQFQIMGITSGIASGGVTGAATQISTTQTSTTSDDAVQKAIDAIMPKGVPEVYGNELGISFDDVTGGLNVLANLERSISFDSLTSSQQQRYIEIATTPDTACEYCCGIGNNGFGTAEGKVACGCSHNLAFSGLTKYLLQNHENEFTNEEIIDEIQKWKTLFFPKQAVQNYLEETGQLSAAASLPGMVGGC